MKIIDPPAVFSSYEQHSIAGAQNWKRGNSNRWGSGECIAFIAASGALSILICRLDRA